MRISLIPAALLALFGGTVVFAGVPAPHVADLSSPDPARSVVVVNEPGTACQFRFRGDGGLDCLTAFVTLRDPYDQPVSGCSTTAGISPISPNPGDGCWAAETGVVLQSCDGLGRSGFSGADGELLFTWSRLGGRGIAELRVTLQCVGTIEIGIEQFSYTSPDLDGSGSVTVLDLALWAGCMADGHECRSSDYDCSCDVDVVDLGIFAGGLALEGCGG